MKVISTIFVAAALAGCATGMTTEEHAFKAKTLYGNDCTRQGYSENSDAWNRCVAGAYIRYVEAQDQQRRATAAAFAFQPRPTPAPVYAPSYAPPVTCSTQQIGMGYSTTTCR